MAKGEPEDEGFLGRWSRRKAETKAVEDGVSPATSADPGDDQELAALHPEREAVDPQPEAVDPATLPDIDKMDAGSDFSMFMQAGVPPALKTKALRKLWRVKPELANLDGLIDYGEDLTGSFKVVDHLKTAYKVGKGFLKDEEPKQTEDEPSADDERAEPLETIAKDDIDPESINQKEARQESEKTLAKGGQEEEDPPKG